MLIFNAKELLRKFIGGISRNESGNVLIMSVVGSVVFIAVTGLAVDYGNAVVQEAKLQKATETAVLAGIQEIPYQQSAMAKMKEYFEMNYDRHDEVNIEYHTAGRSCWVVVDHPVNTYFMRILGQDTLTVNARAKAELQVIEGVHGGIGVTPFVLLNPSGNGLPHDNLTAENHGKPYVLKYSSDNIMVEDWFFGRQIVSALHDHTEGALNDGGWRSVLALDPNSVSPFDASNSNNDFRTNFAEGWQGKIKIGDILDSNPGVMTSGTTQGRRDRLSGWETFSFDGFDPNLDQTNPRIVIVPVVSLGYYDSQGQWQVASHDDVANGNYDWKHSNVDGFAAFFLLTDDEQKQLPGGNSIDRKWVVGRYLHGVNIGGILESSGESNAPDFGMYQGRLVPF